MNSEFNLEKNSSIDDFITRTPAEEKGAKKFFTNKFREQNLDLPKEIKKKEIEKNKEQIEIINLTNDETNKLLKKYGREKFDINLEIIHLFHLEDYEKHIGAEFNFNSAGNFKEKDQGIKIYTRDGKNTRMEFACLSYHEMLHFKEYQILSAVDKDSRFFQSIPKKTRDEERNKNLTKEIPNVDDLYQFIKKDCGENLDCVFYQSGLVVELGNIGKEKDAEQLAKEIPNLEDRRDFIREGRRGGKECFINFNEALAEELTMRFKKDILNNDSYFKEEAELIKEYIEIKKNSGEEINADEIEFARKKITHDINNKEYCKINIGMFDYKEQREVLNMLIDKLYEGNKDRFKNREEVFEVIAKSAFTGDIIGKKGWGRLIDETFSYKTFRELAKIDVSLDNTEKLKQFIDGLEIKH